MVQPLCSSRIPSELVTQWQVQMAFEYLQEGRLHNLPRQSGTTVSRSHRENSVPLWSDMPLCVSGQASCLLM